MASDPLISLATEEQTAILTIANPPANVLSKAVLADLATAVKKLNDDPNIRAAIISGGAGKFFITGADIKELSAIKSKQEGKEYSEKGQALFNQIESAPKPYIAAVEGFCLGGGCELAMACHLRIAGAEARFGQPEINLGLIPGFGGTQRLTQKVGQGRALELLLGGKDISADEALSIGLVNQVVKKGGTLEAALSLAKQIQSKSPLAVSAILSLLNDRSGLSPAERMKKESEAFGSLFESDDAQEGMKAFLEKRLPNFKGR